MIYDYLQAIGAYDVAQGLSDQFNSCLQDDDVQDLHARWDHVLLATSELPHENVLGGFVQDEVTRFRKNFNQHWQRTTKN